MSSRPGPRPHTWIIQGEIPHQQYIAWQRMSCQARFRDEPWDLSFEEFQAVWQPYWHLRGRSVISYCLTREDPELGWTKDNVICIQRIEHLRRKNQETTRRRHEKNL